MHPILQEYQSKIEDIVGTMVRVCASLPGQRKKLLGLASNAKVPLDTVLNECSFDINCTSPVHSDTIENHLNKLEDGGFDELTIGRMCIVYIYALWEDKYRQDFAKSIKCKKNEVESQLFGELNKYRQIIVHNQSRGTSATEKLCILAKVNRKNEVKIDRLMLELIVSEIKNELISISLKKLPNKALQHRSASLHWTVFKLHFYGLLRKVFHKSTT